MENKDDVRAAILRRFESVDQLSYEDTDALAEWLAELEDMDHIRYLVGRSNLEVLARMQEDGLRGQIQIVRALRTLSTAEYDGKRLLDEAQEKMMDILKVLDRPDDPWDANHDPAH